MCMYWFRCECRFGSIRFSVFGVFCVVYSMVMFVVCVWLWKLNSVILFLWLLVILFRLFSVISLCVFSLFSVVCMWLVVLVSGI